MTLLNVSDLSHHYAHGGFSGKHQHQAVLNNVSLALKSGETVALLGRSGCGKSTLARLLVGLESPSQGNISWRGEPLAKLNRAQRKAFRRDIQMVFQDSISAVNPRKTVREILREPMRHLLSLKKAEQLARASEMLKARRQRARQTPTAVKRRPAPARLPGSRAGGRTETADSG